MPRRASLRQLSRSGRGIEGSSLESLAKQDSLRKAEAESRLGLGKPALIRNGSRNGWWDNGSTGWNDLSEWRADVQMCRRVRQPQLSMLPLGRVSTPTIRGNDKFQISRLKSFCLPLLLCSLALKHEDRQWSDFRSMANRPFPAAQTLPSVKSQYSNLYRIQNTGAERNKSKVLQLQNGRFAEMALIAQQFFVPSSVPQPGLGACLLEESGVMFRDLVQRRRGKAM